ncbi:hypothetical protein C8J57DRAFT_1289951 [Mycena rebaudengoi]|nr:hypothetical protein C8J57DRAFT_1289951 [Mycena rebaudengoi]
MLSSVLTTLLLASSAFAASNLKILAPGGPSLWWLAAQDNNIVWNCAEADPSITQFTVWITNKDTKLITGSMAIIPVEQNYICSQGLRGDQITVPVGSGYTLQFTNINNVTDVYAESEPFEVKPLSAGYPPVSATPAASTLSKPASSTSGSGTPTGAGAPPDKSGAAIGYTRASVVGLVSTIVLAAALL